MSLGRRIDLSFRKKAEAKSNTRAISVEVITEELEIIILEERS